MAQFPPKKDQKGEGALKAREQERSLGIRSRGGGPLNSVIFPKTPVWTHGIVGDKTPTMDWMKIEKQTGG